MGREIDCLLSYAKEKEGQIDRKTMILVCSLDMFFFFLFKKYEYLASIGNPRVSDSGAVL